VRLQIQTFAKSIHAYELQGQGGAFEHVLLIGIGGSALGPQFVAEALGSPVTDKLKVHFLDNTDPQGIDDALLRLEGQLGKTLVLVVSKSGGTPETRNGMLEVEAAYRRAHLDFHHHAVAVTGVDSLLDQKAVKEQWLARFPMWDWVGGRTSEFSAVGLLPAALQGLDIDSMLEGARIMDAYTRSIDTLRNPSAILALMWYVLTDGKGKKDMVILPYKDRLMLLSKYLQQLIMESLGKEKDLDGRVVHQGIAVYGNKGSTDQHAYVQQLREGVSNFFATFIEVLKDRQEPSPLTVEPDITSGDYLQGLLLGTREALSQNGRPSLTITFKELSARMLGELIALYERAVGFYAHLVHINAYHQPGVEAGKKAAASILKIKRDLLLLLRQKSNDFRTADAWASELEVEDQTEAIFKLLEHLAANPTSGIHVIPAGNFWGNRYGSGIPPV
jgi:glucose-6-phosphate isomerase